MITFIRQHPFIKTPNYKETFFFNEKYDKGLDYYKSQMPEVTDGELIMEKTPPYLNSPPESLPEIFNKDVPNAKLILVLCDPVKRSYSDFIHEKIKPPNLSTVTQYNSFDDYLDVYIDRVKTSLDKNNNITLKNVMSSYKNDYATTLLTTGLYSIHLPRWINTFNSSNLLILNGEKMIEDPGHQAECKISSEYQGFYNQEILFAIHGTAYIVFDHGGMVTTLKRNSTILRIGRKI
ncbi:heparan sulfate glucosamine 3-O-sulfotransferase 3B1-like isoform X2 [Styela clava]